MFNAVGDLCVLHRAGGSHSSAPSHGLTAFIPQPQCSFHPTVQNHLGWKRPQGHPAPPYSPLPAPGALQGTRWAGSALYPAARGGMCAGCTRRAVLPHLTPTPGSTPHALPRQATVPLVWKKRQRAAEPF